MYLAIMGRISHTPSVDHIVDWTTHKALPFCLVLFWLHHAYVENIHIHVLGSLGTRLGQVNLWFNSLRSSPSFLHLTVCISSVGGRGMAEWVHMVCKLVPSWSGCHAHMPALTRSGSGLGRWAPYFTCYVEAPYCPQWDTVSLFLQSHCVQSL